MVKFISYTGKWPNLCQGVATFDIDGHIVTFGNEKIDGDGEIVNGWPKFWKSGGRIITNRKYQMSAYKDEWVLDDWWTYCPDAPVSITDNIKECLKLFNENVEYGCCGGCI